MAFSNFLFVSGNPFADDLAKNLVNGSFETKSSIFDNSNNNCYWKKNYLVNYKKRAEKMLLKSFHTKKTHKNIKEMK